MAVAVKTDAKHPFTTLGTFNNIICSCSEDMRTVLSLWQRNKSLLNEDYITFKCYKRLLPPAMDPFEHRMGWDPKAGGAKWLNGSSITAREIGPIIVEIINLSILWKYTAKE